MATIKAGTTRAQADAAAAAAVDHAVFLQGRIERLRAATKKAEEARNATIRYASILGAERKAMAEKLGISRGQVYLILDGADDYDGSILRWVKDQQALASHLWELDGKQGSPDDYWPLD